jgi:hypothetical protein
MCEGPSDNFRKLRRFQKGKFSRDFMPQGVFVKKHVSRDQ